MKSSARNLETEELVADLLILNVNNLEKISEKEEKELIYYLITHIQNNPVSKEELEKKSPSYKFFAEQYKAPKLADSENVLHQINFIKALYNPDVAEITTIENSILPDWKSQKMESIKGEVADLALKEKKQTGARIDGIVSYYDNAGAIHKDRDNRVMIGQDFYSKNNLSGSSSDKEIKLALEKTYLKIAFEAAIESGIFGEDDNRILTELVRKGDFYAEKNSEAKPLVKELAEILSVIKEHDVNDDDEASRLFSNFDKLYQQKTKAAGLYSGRAKGFTVPIKISNKSDGKTVTSTVEYKEYKLIDDQGNIMSEPTDANGLGSKKLCSFDEMMEGKGDRAAATEDDIKAARKLIEKYIPKYGNRATYFSSELIARMQLERTEVPSQAPDIEAPKEVVVPERLPVIDMHLVHRRKSFAEDVEDPVRTQARISAASSLLEKIRARKNRPGAVAELGTEAKAGEVVAEVRADASHLRAGAAAKLFASCLIEQAGGVEAHGGAGRHTQLLSSSAGEVEVLSSRTDSKVLKNDFSQRIAPGGAAAVARERNTTVGGVTKPGHAEVILVAARPTAKSISPRGSISNGAGSEKGAGVGSRTSEGSLKKIVSVEEPVLGSSREDARSREEPSTSPSRGLQKFFERVGERKISKAASGIGKGISKHFQRKGR
jgi:hypothetical protein